MPRPRTPIGAPGKISARKQPSGSWRAATRVRDPDGVSRQVAATAPTKAKAEAALLTKVLTRRPGGGRGPVTAQTSISTLCDVWLEGIDKSRRAAGTKERYHDGVRLYVRPALGDLTVQEITPGVVSRFLEALAVQPKLARNVLTMLLDAAVLDGAIGINPARLVPKVVVDESKATRRPRALRPLELLAVRDAIAAWEKPVIPGAGRSIPLRDAVLLELVTGTRIGEVLAIRWCDVDLDRGIVDVNGKVYPVKGVGLVRSEVKTAASEREVHELPEVVIAMLRDRLANLPAGTERSMAPVLPSSEGTFLWPHNVRRAWREARALSKDVDLSWVTPHTLRKTAGTTVAEVAGVLAASKFLGHSSTRVFETHYMDRKAVQGRHGEVLEGLVDGW